MTIVDGVILATAMFTAFQVDTYVGMLRTYLWEKYTEKQCEMCSETASGTFVRRDITGRPKEVDLCNGCMQEAIEGVARETFKQARDDFESGTEY